MRFVVSADDSLINVNDIHKVSPILSKEGTQRCFDRDGTCIGALDQEAVLKLNYGNVIPDVTGSVVIGFCEELTGDTIFSWKLPVIGWQTYFGQDDDDFSYPMPLLPGETLPNVYCIELKTGSFVFPGDRTFDDFDKALEYAREKLGLKKS